MSVKIFFCYAHEDEQLLKELEAQLIPLKRQGILDIWYDRNISAGTEWKREIDKNLNNAQIILLLMSQYFLMSDYCYSVEMKRALERHECGEARVIPIILRPVEWQGGPLGDLQALPKDGKPVTSVEWPSRDDALHDIAIGIHKVIETLTIHVSNELPVRPENTMMSKSETNETIHRGSGLTLLHSAKGYQKFELLGTILYPKKVKFVAMHPDGQKFVCCSFDGTIKIWDLQTWDVLYTLAENFQYPSYPQNLSISPDGNLIACGHYDGTITVWNLQTKQLLRSIKDRPGRDYQDEIDNIAIIPHSHLLASTTSTEIDLWNWHTGRWLHSIKPDLRGGYIANMTRVAVTPNGQTLIGGDYQGNIHFWDLSTGKHLEYHDLEMDPITSIAISTDGQVTAIGDRIGEIRVLNIHTRKIVSSFRGHLGQINSIIFSPDNQVIISGSDDKAIRTWNFSSKQVIQDLEWHVGIINSVAISNDGQILISGSEDATIKIWGRSS